ncbi:MAG TPA: sigma-70 family RNA polymerase sigma factor [Ktedonobacterales bacterium]|nr:sigma-70 family RNA polymerase sigma factor [Ktedonobacterales bacterium]
MNLSADPVGVGNPLASDAIATLTELVEPSPEPESADEAHDTPPESAEADAQGAQMSSAEAPGQNGTAKGRAARSAREPSERPAPTEPTWSFERIYDEYKTPIYNYIYHLVGNREQADDLTQDTFLKAFKALPKMDANLKLSAWLYRIATNTAYDALRRRKLIAWMPWQDLDHEPADVESADPQETIGARELVHAALERMPAHYRAALLLYTQEGFSYAEIATTLNIAESGVKMYLSRARHSFREHYRALEQGGGKP